MSVIPDRVSPSVGYRAWLLDSAGHLRSPQVPIDNKPCWVPLQPLEGVCDQTHEVPGDSCGCGIYAKTTLQGVRSHFWPASGSMVLGEVALWGRTVEHEGGYRSQYAYPTHLFVAKDFPAHFATRLALTYDVSVEVMPQLSKRQRIASFISSPAAAITGVAGMLFMLGSLLSALVLEIAMPLSERLLVSGGMALMSTSFVYLATSLPYLGAQGPCHLPKVRREESSDEQASPAD